MRRLASKAVLVHLCRPLLRRSAHNGALASVDLADIDLLTAKGTRKADDGRRQPKERERVNRPRLLPKRYLYT
jgi:hypothetical protein